MENLVYLLPALACPVGMGLMMWLMMRGQQGHPMSPPATAGPAGVNPAPRAPAVAVDSDDRLAQLHAQLADIETRQAAIATEIERLAAAEPEPPAPTPAGVPR